MDEILERVGLADSQHVRMERYSRGMKQRIHIARGLLMNPDILFLDEPTIGLDPFGAQELRQVVPELAAQGKTVVLTTHYMFEADTLCQTIAMVNKGRLVALGSPADIKRRLSGVTIIEVTVRDVLKGLTGELSRLDGVRRVDVGAEGILHKLTVHVDSGTDHRERIAAVAEPAGIEDMITREPTLEEAYLNMLK